MSLATEFLSVLSLRQFLFEDSNLELVGLYLGLAEADSQWCISTGEVFVYLSQGGFSDRWSLHGWVISVDRLSVGDGLLLESGQIWPLARSDLRVLRDEESSSEHSDSVESCEASMSEAESWICCDVSAGSSCRVSGASV
jgi:hypothetical protein